MACSAFAAVSCYHRSVIALACCSIAVPTLQMHAMWYFKRAKLSVQHRIQSFRERYDRAYDSRTNFKRLEVWNQDRRMTPTSRATPASLHDVPPHQRAFAPSCATKQHRGNSNLEQRILAFQFSARRLTCPTASLNSRREKRAVCHQHPRGDRRS
jgi:hypothetical protein